MDISGWDVVHWIHLLAMALFVGGQLFLGLAVVPTYIAQGGKEGRAHEWMQPIARRYGWASLAALAVSLVTGSMMAGKWDMWDDTEMRLKLALVTLAIVLTVVHVFVVKGSNRLLQTLILLVSLAIVLVATTL